MESACLEDPLVQAVQQRVSDVTQVLITTDYMLITC